jgi:hypothetical protein
VEEGWAKARAEQAEAEVAPAEASEGAQPAEDGGS